MEAPRVSGCVLPVGGPCRECPADMLLSARPGGLRTVLNPLDADKREGRTGDKLTQRV